MKPTYKCLLLYFSLCLCLPAPSVWGQAAASPPTLWSFLGVSQAAKRARDGILNRRGNFPALEKKPPVLKLADPANLASENPAIKRAAEIKQQEDLKKQKIKAIKYLTKIGCGCYDQDGSVTAAIEDASKDCTEDVRLTAVEQIKAGAEGGCCSKCGERSCCNEKLIMRLAQMAYERDENGCYLEPSEEVREAAKEALKSCCPRELSDFEVEMELPEPVQPVDPERETAPEAPAERESAPEIDGNAPPAFPADDTALRQPTATRRVEQGVAEWSTERARTEPTSVPSVQDRDEAPRGLLARFFPRDAATSATTTATATQPIGELAGIDTNRGIAHVHITAAQPLPIGSVLHVYRQNQQTTELVGTMSVYEAFAGSVNVRATGSTDFAQLQRGNQVWLIPSTQQAPAPVVRRVSHMK